MTKQRVSRDQVAAGEKNTFFAPAERAGLAELTASRAILQGDELFQALSRSFDGHLMVLNAERQVLVANEEFRRLIGSDDPVTLVGYRPGELVGCVQAEKAPGGCGTSKACRSCGTVLSILRSQESGEPITSECLLRVENGGYSDCLELRVRATPVEIQGEKFTFLILNDISAEKRRRELERTFFHDILNTIGGLMGWSGVLRRSGEQVPPHVAQKIQGLSRQLADEVEDQRRLAQAENGKLDVSKDTVAVAEILERVRTIFDAHAVSRGKHLDIEASEADAEVTTDPTLLIRVLTNMVKNAFEAIELGQCVGLRYARCENEHVFFVRNPGVIPEDVALRIFQRSFSTKSKQGRGVGTYSMKLFGEKYLGGAVDFESSEDRGTVFFIRLPAFEAGGERSA
ncbi:MAG: sensor histidine kinase [Candidatus Binatia bacterium]